MARTETDMDLPAKRACVEMPLHVKKMLFAVYTHIICINLHVYIYIYYNSIIYIHIIIL